MDMLLTLVGLLLVVAGLLVFLFGRSRPGQGPHKNNVFEAFGIKLDVANPSVLLIILGAVMMLAPRFVPMEEDGQPLAATVSGWLGGSQPEVAIIEEPMPSPSAETLDQAKQPGQPEPPVVTAPAASPPPESLVNTAPATAAGTVVATPTPTAPIPAPVALQVARVETPAVSPPVPAPALKIGILTEAFNYDNEAEASLRAKMKTELHGLVSNMVAGSPTLDYGNQGFRRWTRKGMRDSSIGELCKRTGMDRLLLADFTRVTVPGDVESANWPEMRYTMIDCKSRQFTQSATMRMEPVVRDAFPMQQSLQRTARRFIHEHRYLLEQ